MKNNRIYKTTDLEDAARYALHAPLIIGHDFAREPDRTVVIEAPRNIGKSFAMAFFDEAAPVYSTDFNFTITAPSQHLKGSPMQETTPTKIFTTKDVPGFEDGHPLKLHRPLVLGSPFASSNIEFIANRTTEEGVILNVRIPCTPEAFAAHIRVKNAPKVPEKK